MKNKNLLIVLLLIALQVGCGPVHLPGDLNERLGIPDPEVKKQQQIELISLILYASATKENGAIIERSECRAYSGSANPLYPTSAYFTKFFTDQTDYEVVIRGDSTMDISSQYDWFLSPASQSVAVSGNTLCDMIEQVPAIKTVNPSAVIISTAGGNDLMHGIDLDLVIQSGKLLIDQTRSKFPFSKIVMVGIHPTFVTFGNENKAYTNSAIRDYLLNTYPDTCWIDPLPIFGKAEGEPPDASQMLDSIHYNETISGLVKDSILSLCGVQI